MTAPPGPLLLRGARIRTLEGLSEPCDILLRNGRIAAVGEPPDEPAETLDLAGRTVLPGLHDSHLHCLMLGRSLSRLDVFEVPSPDEALARVKAFADGLPPGEWLLGRGWLQELWPGGAFPTRWQLDSVAPDRPVCLAHKSGHACWCNSAALALAGLADRAPGSPERVLCDADGRPTGILFEDAMGLVARHIPEPSAASDVEALNRAQREAHRLGLTAVQCLDGAASLRAFQTLRERGELRLRVTSHLSAAQLDPVLDAGLRTGFGDEWLRLGHLKLFADGALGSLTAWMIEPYEGRPGDHGVCCLEPSELRALVLRAAAAGIPSAVHAIGDRAVREVLDAFAAAREVEGARSLRHRIEHAQVIHPADLRRFAELEVIASMQPIHATQDMPMVDRHWGARGRYAYAFRTLLSSGARLAFGSDAPVESLSPFVGLHAAVTRRRADGSPGEEGWYAEERLTWGEALAGYTVGAAWSCGREGGLGGLAPGYRADLLVLDVDPGAVDPAGLHALRPAMTFAGGECVWRAEE
ncbi:MAG: amidohydrolase [Armatimonadetes bacterium]|nr:amidohydrolase [Armatimonadota bacterium]